MPGELLLHGSTVKSHRGLGREDRRGARRPRPAGITGLTFARIFSQKAPHGPASAPPPGLARPPGLGRELPAPTAAPPRLPGALSPTSCSKGLAANSGIAAAAPPGPAPPPPPPPPPQHRAAPAPLPGPRGRPAPRLTAAGRHAPGQPGSTGSSRRCCAEGAPPRA